MFFSFISSVISNSSYGKLVLTSIVFGICGFSFLNPFALLIFALPPVMAHTLNQCEELCVIQNTQIRVESRPGVYNPTQALRGYDIGKIISPYGTAKSSIIR